MPKTRFELEQIWQEKLSSLNDIDLPDTLEWSDTHVPEARKHVEETYAGVMKAMFFEKETVFDNLVEKYIKMWLRLWQLQAKDHFHSRDIMDVDMRYYRHLPDGYSMEWDSKKLGFKFKVYPRKPKKDPGMRWITAGELLKMHETPVIFGVMEVLEGWFDRDSPDDNEAIAMAMEEDKKLEPKLKFDKKDKYGFEWYK